MSSILRLRIRRYTAGDIQLYIRTDPQYVDAQFNDLQRNIGYTSVMMGNGDYIQDLLEALDVDDAPEWEQDLHFNPNDLKDFVEGDAWYSNNLYYEDAVDVDIYLDFHQDIVSFTRNSIQYDMNIQQLVDGERVAL